MRVRTRTVVAILAAALSAGIARAHEPMRAEADAMQTKIDRVAAAAEAPRPTSAPPLRTAFTEREINSYLALDGPEFLPAGIAMPRMQLGDGCGRARSSISMP